MKVTPAPSLWPSDGFQHIWSLAAVGLSPGQRTNENAKFCLRMEKCFTRALPRELQLIV